MVESCRVGVEMPFAYDGSLVFVLNEFRESLLTSVEDAAVVGEAVGVTMFSGEQTCTRGSADGVGDKTVVEAYAFVGDAVNIRSAYERSVVCADSLIRMVIRHDEKYVHRFLLAYA